MVAVDDDREVQLAGCFDPRSRGIGGVVERYGDGDESVLGKFSDEGIPDRDLVATSSPGGPGDQQPLAPGEVAHPHHAAVEIRQLEVVDVPADARPHRVAGDRRDATACIEHE